MRLITHKLIAVFLNLVVATLAFANDEIVSRSYYLDPTNAMSFDQVEKEAFVPYGKVLTGGFQTGTYWLKLKLRPSYKDQVLRIRPLFTEEIEFFDPASNEKSPLIGAKHPWKATEIQGASYNFLIKPDAKERDVFLRVKSARTYLIYVDVMSKEQFEESNYFQQLIYTGYSALTMMLALWLFITWLMNREMVLGVFTIQQSIAFLHTTFNTGFVRPLIEGHISPANVNYFFSLTVVTYPFVSILANKLLLEEYGLKKTYRVIFNGLLLCSTVVIVLYLSNHSASLKLNNFLVLALFFFYAVSSVFGTDMSRAGFKANALSIHVLRAFYAVNLVLWVFTILPYLGLIPAGEIALNAVFIYSLMSGLVFFFLLQYRSNSLLKFETAKSSALKAEADQERKQREEQGMLMAMLSHEIKTPLSVLKLVVDEKVAGSDLEGHANRAVNNIDLIVERCLQLGKLDAEAVSPNIQEIHLGDFLRQIVADMKISERIRMDCDPGLKIHSDSDLMRVVVFNLLENASKYSPKGSAIELTASIFKSNRGSRLQLEVASESGLFGKPDPEQVFKKYYRNVSATKITGTGLGLYLVKELVGVLAGDVEYVPDHSRVVFKIWIPA